jgi:hypothetical protein
LGGGATLYRPVTAGDAGLYGALAGGELPGALQPPGAYSDEVLEDQPVEGTGRFVAYADGRVKARRGAPPPPPRRHLSCRR